MEAGPPHFARTPGAGGASQQRGLSRLPVRTLVQQRRLRTGESSCGLVAAEVLDMADRAGLDPARFAEVVAGSDAATASPLFRDVAPRMAAGEHTAVEALTTAAVELGHGRDDTSALIERYRARRSERH